MNNRKAAFSAESYDRDILNTIPYYDEVYDQIADVVSVVLSSVDFLKLPIEEINYNSQFDVITSILVNHYMTYEERMIAVRNCYHALKEEGIFLHLKISHLVIRK